MTRHKARVVSAVTCCLLTVNPVAPQSAQEHPRPVRALESVQNPVNRPAGAEPRRLVDGVAWLAYGARRRSPALTLQRLMAIFADQRAIDRAVEGASIAAALNHRFNDALRRAHLDGDMGRRLMDLEEARRVFDAMATEYERLVADARAGRDAGLFGLLLEFAGQALGGITGGVGQFLLPAVGAGLHRAADGGSLGEVLFTMGLYAGAAFESQQLEALLRDPSTSAHHLALANARVAAYEGASVAFNSVPAGVASKETVSTFPSVDEADAEIRAVAPAPRMWAGPPARLSPIADRRADMVPWLEAVIWSAVDSPGFASATRPPSLWAAATSARWRRGRRDPGSSVLTPGLLLRVRQKLRVGVERLVETERVAHELQTRARTVVERIGQEVELGEIDVAVEEQERANALLVAHLERLRAAYSRQSSGFLGAGAGLLVGFVGSMVGGPFLGAALAGGIGTALNGGGPSAVLLAAGVSTGRFYVARRAALQGAGVDIPAEAQKARARLASAFPAPPTGPGSDLEYIRTYEAYTAAGGDVGLLPSEYTAAYIQAYVRLGSEETLAFAETLPDLVSLGLSAKDFKDEPSVVNGLFVVADGVAVLTPLPSTGTTKVVAEAGSRVFRVFGGKAKETGRSWTTLNPLSDADHLKVNFGEYTTGIRRQLGLPAGNAATSVATGTTTGAIPVDVARRLRDMPGGAPEIRLDPKLDLNMSESVPILPYGDGNLSRVRPR